MKLIFFSLLSLLLISNIHAQEEEKHPLTQYMVVSEQLPTEFNLMIEHLKQSKLTQDDLERLISASELINKELATTPEPNIMFLFKSEIYKGILNNQYMKQNSLLQASTSILESTKHKLEKNKVSYTNFSKWIIQSIIKDFDPFLEKNFINQYQNIKRSNSAGMLLAKRLQKVMKYLAPWLNAIDKHVPEDFNKLCTKIIIDTIERISKKTYYFKTFTGELEPDSEKQLIAVPAFETKERVTSKVTDEKSLKEEATERKKDAQEDVEDLDSDDLSGASEEIDKLDENNETETEEEEDEEEE